MRCSAGKAGLGRRGCRRAQAKAEESHRPRRRRQRARCRAPRGLDQMAGAARSAAGSGPPGRLPPPAARTHLRPRPCCEFAFACRVKTRAQARTPVRPIVWQQGHRVAARHGTARHPGASSCALGHQPASQHRPKAHGRVGTLLSSPVHQRLIPRLLACQLCASPPRPPPPSKPVRENMMGRVAREPSP